MQIDLLLHIRYTLSDFRSEAFQMETHSTSKGQIVIPSSIRRKLGIKQGTRIHVECDEEGRRIVLTPITPDFIQSLRGKYKGRGLVRSLMEEKQRERDL